MHPVVVKVLKKDANGARAFKLIPEISEIKGTPIENEIQEFLNKHRRRNVDKWYLMGWMRGKCMAEAINRSLQKTNNKVPDDLFLFRKMIRDELEGLKDFDLGAGPTFPRINYADHKGFVAALVMKAVDGKWVQATKEYIHIHYKFFYPFL